MRPEPGWSTGRLPAKAARGSQSVGAGPSASCRRLRRVRANGAALFAALFLPALLLPADVSAQGQLVPQPGEERPELPDFEAPEREPGLVLPPLELPSEPDTRGLARGLRVFVREIHISGNTVLPEAKLREIARPYTNREVSFAEVEQLRDELTLSYIEAGYVTSGAEVPPQSLADGVLEIRIVEGELTGMSIETDGRFRERYLRKRLELATAGPVNVHELERRLQVLQQDQRIKRVRAALAPGERPGESYLNVSLEEAKPYRLRAEGNNYEAPSIGGAAGGLEVAFTNVTGWGDSLWARYRGGEGIQEAESRYELPLTAYDTILELRFRRSWGEVVEAPFDELDITSTSETYGFRLRQPVFRTERTIVELFLAGEWRRSQSFLDGEGIAFVPGPDPDDGKAVVTVLRFGGELLYRTRRDAFALRSTLNWGIDALGATVNVGDIPDGEFVSWLGQLQWARRFRLLNAELILRGDAQLSDRALLGLEQFAIGGRYTVRGYREKQLVRDNGLAGSIEVRIPLWNRPENLLRPEVAAFLDAGYSWNRNRASPDPKTLLSVGVGGRLRITEYARLEVYWGESLRDVDRLSEWNLQDAGVHIGVTARFP